MKNLNLTPVCISVCWIILLLLSANQSFAQKCPDITGTTITPAEICEGGTISVCVDFSSSPNNVTLEGVDEYRDGTSLCFDTTVAYPDDILPPCEPVELSSAVTFTAVCEGNIIEAPATVATFTIYPDPTNFLPTVSFEACNTEPIVTPGICPVEVALTNVIDPVVDCISPIDGSADWEVILPFSFPDCFVPPTGDVIIPACLEPCVCPEIIGIGVSDIAFCDGEAVEICVNFDKPLDVRTIVDINGIIQDGAAGEASICAMIPLENTTCDLLLVDIIIDATCDGAIIDNPFTVLPVSVFPSLDLFIPEVIPGIACEAAPVINAGICGIVTTDILIPADNSCGATVDGLLSWTIDPGFADYPDCFVLPAGEVALPACELCCPSEAIATPTVEAVCGDATPTLPDGVGLGIDDLTNTIVTWSPDPTVLIVASCILQEVVYTPTITCIDDENVLIVGPTHTLTVYPDPASYVLVEPTPAACGEIPVLENSGACDLIISLPEIVAPIDGCTDKGNPPVDGSYTFNISDPFTGSTPCELVFEPVIIPVAACEVCPVCPAEVVAEPTAEVVCGDATPTLPADIDLGINDLTNAIITWSPDPTEVVASTCEPITVVYIPTITCSDDETVELEGPSHSLTVYPDPSDYDLFISEAAACGEVPVVVNMGVCEILINESEITAPVDGCSELGSPPVDGLYTFTLLDPYDAETPCPVTFELIEIPVAACEICPNCPNEATGGTSLESICGDGLPTLPAIEDLEIDDLTNAVITWSPDPTILVEATCELQVIEYTPIITCTENPDVQIAGPVHTLKVYPDPADYIIANPTPATCGEVPVLVNTGACEIIISEPVIVAPIDGCTAEGNPPVDGAYTFSFSFPYSDEAPCDLSLDPITVSVAACEVCSDCPTEATAIPTTEIVCGNALPTLPPNSALGIDVLDIAVVTWSPDPSEEVIVACEAVSVEYIPTITCISDPDLQIIGSSHTLTVYPSPINYTIAISNAAACGEIPSITNTGTCDLIISDPEIQAPVDGCTEQGNPPIAGSYTFTITDPYAGLSPCEKMNDPVTIPVAACEVCTDYCPSEAVADPTSEVLCGNATPTLPADADLGIDYLNYAVITWSPDPTELVVVGCEPVSVEYVPTITCSIDPTISITGPSHSLTLYPDVDSYSLSDVNPAACGQIPNLVNVGTCDLLISDPIIVDPVDGCTVDGTPPVAGSYTFNVLDPHAPYTPCDYTIAPIVIPVAGCEVCVENCPTTATADPTTEVLCGNAIPSLPSDNALGIDHITNAVVNWSPDPTELVVVGCEPVTVEYVPTITCISDPTIQFTGPSHTLTLYPAASSYELQSSGNVGCGETPSLVNIGACDLIISDPVIVAPVDGCEAEEDPTSPGSYTYTVTVPYAASSPCVQNIDPVTMAVAPCENCKGCPTEATAAPIIDRVCGSALPDLPSETELGIDNINNVVVTWNLNPLEPIIATCELQVIEYIPTITCAVNADVSFTGPTYTLKVYPDPASYQLNNPSTAACGEIPALINLGTCNLTISAPAIVQPQDGCVAANIPFVAGSYTYTVSDPYAGEAPCFQSFDPITIAVNACEDCSNVCGITVPSISSSSPTCGVTDGTISITATGGTGSYQYSIDGGTTWFSTNNFTGLPIGTYTIAVRNSDGTCTHVDGSVTLNTTPPPGITNISTTNPRCNAQDGMIVISAASGSGSYQYSIDGGTTWQTSNTFTGLNAGNYTIAVRNADGSCMVLGDQIQLTASFLQISDVALQNPSCDNTNGSIIISAGGGTGSYEYSIDGGATWQASGVFNNLTAGTYTLFIRNSDGTCVTGGMTRSLTGGTSPQINDVNIANPSTCGVNNGTITVSGIGGSGTYQYSIDNGNTWQSSNVFTGLAGGNYPLAIRNADGTCVSFWETVVLAAPGGPTVADIQVSAASDCSASDGQITIITSGGSGFEYTIDGGSNWQTSATFTGLASGTYYVAVRNIGGGCTTSLTTAVFVGPTAPIITAVVATATNCDNNGGTISISATGGLGSYQYSIDGGVTWQNTSNFGFLPAGIYSIRVRNSNGSCIVTEQAIVNEAMGCHQCITPSGLDQHCVQIVQSNNTSCCQIWGAACQEAYDLCNGTSQTATVGQYVWIDQDGDGIKDPNEPAIAGVEVSLYDNTGILIGVLFTDSNGQFLFSDIPPGNYYVAFDLPTGYSFTSQDMGNNEFTDSDANPSNGVTNTFAVFPGDVNLTIGAGLVEDAACSLPYNIVTEQICQNGVTGTYDLVVQISGGAAPYVVSGVFNGIFTEGEVQSVRINEGDGFDIFVSDANGCAQSVSNNDLIPCSKLVVDLLEFTGEATSAGNELTWTTATETDNAFFTIYKSTDGINFEPITQVDGQGNTIDLTTYSFLDKEATGGISYYYLSQTDFDGTTTEISDVIAIQRGEQASFDWIRVSPVPANDQVIIHFESGQTDMIQIQLYDLIGQAVIEKTVQATLGTQTHSLSIGHLPAGVYIVLLNNGHEQLSGKVIKE